MKSTHHYYIVCDYSFVLVLHAVAQSAIVGGSMGGVITLILLLLILIVVVFLTCRHLKKRKFNLIENIRYLKH